MVESRIIGAVNITHFLHAVRPFYYTAEGRRSFGGSTSLQTEDHPRFNESVELGMRNQGWLMTDPNLDSVRDDPRFATLLTEVPPAD